MISTDVCVDVATAVGPIVNAIEKAGFRSTMAFAKAHDLPYGSLIGLVAKTQSPLYTSGEFRAITEKLMVALNKTFDELFSDWPEEDLMVERSAQEIEAERVFASSMSTIYNGMQPEEYIDNSRIQEVLDEVFEMGLTNREQFILNKHYGLDGEPQTQAEIGELLDISPARVSSIELKALRKLRHPTRSNLLAMFLPDVACHLLESEVTELPSLFSEGVTLTEEEAANEQNILAFGEYHGPQWLNLRPEDCDFVKGHLEKRVEKFRTFNWMTEVLEYEVGEFEKMNKYVALRWTYLEKLPEALREELTRPRNRFALAAFQRKLVPYG